MPVYLHIGNKICYKVKQNTKILASEKKAPLNKTTSENYSSKFLFILQNGLE